MKLFLTITILLCLKVNLSAQQYYKASCPVFNGDHGKEYALDTVNFKAYLPAKDLSGWKIYEVDLLTGSSYSLSIETNGPISAMLFRNDSLFFGGSFTTVNGIGTIYKYFAVYNIQSGSLLPGMNANLDGAVTEISIHKNKLFIAGGFNTVLTLPRKKIVSLNFNVSPLTISPVTYPADLTAYFGTNAGIITKMKTYGDHLFFIIDSTYLYSFSPYPPAGVQQAYHFKANGNPVSDAIYDYLLIGNQMFISGSAATGYTSTDLQNLVAAPSYALYSISSDMVMYYNLFGGTFRSNYDNLSLSYSVPPGAEVNNISAGVLYGVTGMNYRNNVLTLLVNRYLGSPPFDKNDIIRTDTSLSDLSSVVYSEIADPPGNVLFTPFHTLTNLKSFSNIITVASGFIDQRSSNYFQNGMENDSLMLLRNGVASLQGFSQNYGPFCKGDTLTLKLRKQKNLHAYQWSYSVPGMNIIMANDDSAKVVFNYGAAPGNIKIVATDNFNMPTDTFYHAVTFKPIPDADAGADKVLTCKKTTVKLTATTALSNFNLDWITPAGFTALDSLSGISSTGTYYVRIKDNITGCYGFDTVLVNIDTIKPNLSFPATNIYSLTCAQNSRTITANAANSSDTVYWTGKPKFVSTSSITATVPGKLYVNCVAAGNGCKRIDSVNITQSVILPPISNNVLKDSLTCTRDSVFLNGSSSGGNILFWRRPGFPLNDSLPDPIYTKLVGYHTLVVRDPASGCKSSLAINVSNNALLPYVAVPSHTANITCSQSSISLNGSSATSGAILNWQGPASFASSNPAVISNIGTYTLTATDPSNGCQKSDTVLVTKQNSLLLQSSNDTTICHGSSATINSVPLGGTAPYTYSWLGFGNSSQLIVSPSDTTKYSVTITDNTGCTGKDSVIVNVPDVLSDSTITFQPCDPNNPNGQIQVYAKGGTAPYVYNLNNGAYQSSNIFTGLSFGNYTVGIKDVIGCEISNATQINSNSLAPSSDFIVSTHLFHTDTFVVVDISNPKPDTVIWSFPVTFTVINTTNPFAPVVMCADTGFYNIQQTAYFGGCQTVFNKVVHITYNDGSFANAFNNNGIQSVSLSPNPNDGQFNLSVSMYKKQTFAIFVNDASGIEKLRITVNDNDAYSGNIVVSNVTNGTYVLKVISAYDSKHVLFVITQ